MGGLAGPGVVLLGNFKSLACPHIIRLQLGGHALLVLARPEINIRQISRTQAFSVLFPMCSHQLPYGLTPTSSAPTPSL